MDMGLSSEVCGSFNQIQMNLALIPCEIFRAQVVCVYKLQWSKMRRLEFVLGDFRERVL
ncbi:hypothetical protein YC2023_061209 [Brassica napus]